MLEDVADATILRYRHGTFHPPVLVMLRTQNWVTVHAWRSHWPVEVYRGFEGVVGYAVEHGLVNGFDSDLWRA